LRSRPSPRSEDDQEMLIGVWVITRMARIIVYYQIVITTGASKL